MEAAWWLLAVFGLWGVKDLIFSARNEDGVPLWKLVVTGAKTVTRRTKPLAVGKEFAVQPGRGKKAVCRAVVVSCEKEGLQHCFDDEAKREGFKSWEGLREWLIIHNPNGVPFYRIEFKVLKT